MSISITTRAADRVHAFINKRDSGIGIRLAVTTTGCSGMAYVIEFADKLNDDDIIFDSNNVKIIVDSKSLIYLTGTELDYVKTGLNEGFEFNNPNVKDECGCGESFTV